MFSNQKIHFNFFFYFRGPELVKRAHLLIQNYNNNRCEQLTNVEARVSMGKRLNLVQRGSYERRVNCCGLRYNKSFKWHLSN